MAELYQLTKPDPISGRPIPVSAKERIDAILDHPRAAALVRSLDVQELYSLIHEAGMEDGMDLVLYASAEQVQGIVDFDCWTRDDLEPTRVSAWLEVLLQREDEDFADLMTTLDPELLVIWLRQQCQVFVWEDDAELIEAIDAPVFSSPDGVYAIVVPDDEELAGRIRHVLDRVYAMDLLRGHRLLEATRWELTTDMMERAYQQREARLGDLGFVPVHEAVEVYAYRNPADWAAGARARARAPELDVLKLSAAGTLPPTDRMLQHLETDLGGDGGFLERSIAALGQVVPDAQLEPAVDSIFGQLRALVNRRHIADLGQPGDLDAARGAMRSVADTLSIALEYASGGDLLLSARTLASTPLRDAHQAGASIVAGLAKQARDLERRGNLTLVDGQPSLLEADVADLFDGLRARRPLRSAVDAAPFRRLSEVHAAARVLAEAAFLEMVVFGTLRHTRGELASVVFDPNRCVTPVELITFRVLLGTLAVAALADSHGGLEPVTAQALERAIARGRGEGGLARSATTALRALLRVPDGAAPLADAVAASVGEWLAGELGGASVAPEIARQVVLLAP
ncbi:MAG: hypothetical protein H6698_03280 [Myxococcales bacterium]|nr:hypothetical protein [Myxococcales bacterium]MCB9519327.1 hypothetical protein [Myxococcales bacterium]MCB9530771.1 hypothetical protein [Myxococcales bacterium]MCB9533335.1 hypothetical protein [Myxococcales bacterium]